MIKKNNQTQENKNIQLVLLRTVNNNFELDSVTSLLEENNIPYILKDHGTGGYMRIISGNSMYGTDILVEELFFERANDLLDSISLKE